MIKLKSVREWDYHISNEYMYILDDELVMTYNIELSKILRNYFKNITLDTGLAVYGTNHSLYALENGFLAESRVTLVKYLILSMGGLLLTNWI